MTETLGNRIIILILIAAGIVLNDKGTVSAVTVSVFLIGIIVAALSEATERNGTTSRTTYILNILAAALMIGAFFEPMLVFVGPVLILSLIPQFIARMNSLECVISLIIGLEGLFIPGLDIYGRVTAFLLCLLSSYMAAMTEYRGRTISSLREKFDDARLLARDREMRRREQSNITDSEVYNATLKERNRIAREIHDNVGHMLTRALIQMQALKIINKDEVVGQQLDSVNETLDLAMTNIRKSVHELHDDSIDLALEVNGISKSLPERFDVNVSTSIDSPVDSSLKAAILGIIREAVTNIAKYSSGKRVKIEIVENISFWRILVEDDGSNEKHEYEPDSVSDGSGIGLTNIFERARGQGGRARIYSDRDGFHIFVTIPK